MKRVGRAISLINYLKSVVVGVVLGIAGVLLYNTLVPVGLLVTLISTGVGIWFLGRSLGSRKFKFISALSWLAVVLRAGTPGNGNELLILGNLTGDLFLLFGISTVTFSALRKI